MKLTRIIAFAAIAVTCGLGTGQAETLRDAGEPAEFPPSSFTGRQYVDSAGCVFIRAGIDGNTTWVPRVSRSRKTICGQTPTFASARAPEVAPAAQPVQKAAAVPAPEPAAPTPKRVVAAKPAPAKAVRASKVRRTAPVLVPAAQTTLVPVQILPAADVKGQRQQITSPCPGATGISALYKRQTAKGSGFVVRCGPQGGPFVTRVPGTVAPRIAPGYYAPSQYDISDTALHGQVVTPETPGVNLATTRVAPRRIVRTQRRAVENVVTPDGYKRVWMDGRLNPHRAHQTFAGKAEMERMWTKTVPRRLILTDTGREVTDKYPGLIYPYTSYAQQNAALAAGAYAQSPTIVSQRPQSPTISSKSTEPAAQARATAPQAGQHYVQAGVFATRAQAMQAAQRLAGTGLPTRLGSLTRGSAQYSLVLSGPYGSQGAASGALAKARQAGFNNAILR